MSVEERIIDWKEGGERGLSQLSGLGKVRRHDWSRSRPLVSLLFFPLETNSTPTSFPLFFFLATHSRNGDIENAGGRIAEESSGRRFCRDIDIWL